MPKKIVFEQLSVNNTVYIEMQARKRPASVRVTRDMVFAEEFFTSIHLRQGMIQIRALETKVVDVRNR
jgi:hypothetical protein